MTGVAFIDVGVTAGAALIDAVLAGMAEMGLDSPGVIEQIAGTGVTPINDPCDGQLWARVGTAFPTDGSGQPYIEPRSDFSIPAWATFVEVGLLWCHNVIDENGDGPPADDMTSYAQRDGQYRSALLLGITSFFPAQMGACLDGFALSPWSPIGPDGGYSGGGIVVTVITNRLVIDDGT